MQRVALGSARLTTQIDLTERHRRGVGQVQANFAITVLDETAAQRLVTQLQIDECLLHCVDIQLAAHRQTTGDVVQRAVRLQLPEEPKTALGRRQRQRAMAIQTGHFGAGRCIDNMTGQRSDESAQHRRLEQQARLHCAAMTLTQACQ